MRTEGLFRLKKYDIPLELKEDFQNNQIYLNVSRIRMFSIFILIMVPLLLYIDFKNAQTGLWLRTQGYQWLFYSHIALGVGMVFIIALSWNYKRYSPENLRRRHKFVVLFFTFFGLCFSAVTSGWIDPLIHGQITVFIMACFTIAVIVYLNPKESSVMYLSSFIILVVGLSYFQKDTSILEGHYINATLLIFIAWFLSITQYKLKVKDFLHQNHLEMLVKERTVELEGINQALEREINERREVEEKILRLASIVSSTDDGIIGMTLDGVIRDWNKGAEDIYGYCEAEIIGNVATIIAPIEKHPEVREILATIREGTPVSRYETVRQRKDGQCIDVSVTVSPIKDRTGKIIGASTIVRDVTEQKKLRDEMQRLDQLNLVGEMAASIGHEVRNPMTTVRGFLQLLGKKEALKPYNGHFSLMIDELDRANAIITEFLAISRTKTTELAKYNLNRIIESILPLIQADATHEDKSVRVELSPIPDLLLDDKEIRQVIFNLSRNGLEAMGKGGRLLIKTYLTEHEVNLAIQDEGMGIKPEMMEKLGTPFITTKEKGTGLGLAVCFGIVARHHAKIEVESSPRGSTFFVKFKDFCLSYETE